jgi:hypothetical protein
MINVSTTIATIASPPSHIHRFLFISSWILDLRIEDLSIHTAIQHHLSDPVFRLQSDGMPAGTAEKSPM